MAKIIESRRILKSRLDAKQDVLRAIPALMGDGNGNVAIANQPGYVYIRIGDGDLGQAFNNRCPQRDNLAIYVGYDPVTDPDRRTFQVLSVRMADYAGAGNTPTMNVPPHHAYHEYGGGDDVYVDWRRLMGLRVGRPSGFSVTTDQGVILRAGVWTAVASQTLALAAMKPAGLQQARYVLIVLNAAGVATATAGALKTIATLAISDCPIPGAGEIPLAAVRLYGIQTSIGDIPSAPDIVDLRFPQTTMTGTVFLSSLSGWARGSIIRGGAAVWEAYALGGITGSVVTRDATDVVWSSFALAGTAAQTYTFPAVTGGVALGAGGLTNATVNDATIANHTHAITGTFTPGAHDILSASHGDTLAAAVVRGSLIYGNATPKWASLGLGGITGSVVTRNATDVLWSAGALSFGGAFTLTISGNASIGGTAITGTPGTLTVSTANAAADPHTHAITSSSNPGAAASILASTAAGLLTLVGLTTTAVASVTTPADSWVGPSLADGLYFKNNGLAIGGVAAWAGNSLAISRSSFGYHLSLVGCSQDLTTDINGVSFALTHNVAGNRQIAFVDNVTNVGFRFIPSANYMGGYNAGALANMNLMGTMYVTTGNQVGIGVAAPSTKLHVVGTADVQQFLVVGFTTQTSAVAQVTRNDVTAGVSAMLGLTAKGSAAIGDGGSIIMAGLTSIASQTMARIYWLYTDPTSASRKSDLVFSAWDTAEREFMRGRGSGTVAQIGFFGVTPVSQQLATTDIGVVLSNLGLRAAGTAYPITTSGTVTLSGNVYTSMPEFDTLPVVDAGAAGSYYIGGFYDLVAAKATLTIGGTVTQTYGTALNAKAARAICVVSGPSAGATVLTVTGVSIDDNGTRNDTDSEILIANCSTVAANAFFQTSKKWLGQVTYTLSGGVGGNALSFNYGLVRGKSNCNTNFTLKSLVFFALGGATDTGLNLELIHHKTTGWTYSAAAFTYPTANRIIMMSTDYGANTRIASGVYVNWRRSNLSTAIAGATGGEGYIVRITTTANNSVRWGYCRMGFSTTP